MSNESNLETENYIDILEAEIMSVYNHFIKLLIIKSLRNTLTFKSQYFGKLHSLLRYWGRDVKISLLSIF